MQIISEESNGLYRRWNLADLRSYKTNCLPEPFRQAVSLLQAVLRFMHPPHIVTSSSALNLLNNQIQYLPQILLAE